MSRRPPPPSRRRRRLLLLSAAAASVLLLSFSSSSSTTNITAATLSAACRATRFPELCFSTLSSQGQIRHSPTHLIRAAISAAERRLPTAISAAESILSTSSADLDRATASRNCLSHLALSSHRLSNASSAVFSSPAAARAYSSAALLYVYDCWSALNYVNYSGDVAAAMEFLASLSQITSNALSMITSFQISGDDFSSWSPPKTEHDGFWLHTGGAANFHGGIVKNLPVNATVRRHNSIQSAINSAPDFSLDHFVIYIESGVYNEVIRIPFEKTNIVIIGDGMGTTVITSNLNATTRGFSTYNTATVGVAGDGFMASKITFENAAGEGAHQAVAFMSDSDRSVLENVEIRGHQDTLYARSLRQLYQSCHISGTVDFIFGNAAAVFDNCTILIVPRLGSPEKGEKNAITAHGRTDPAQATGFVIRNCVVNGTEEYLILYNKKPGVHRNYLGRPWKEFSRTVFIDCYLEKIVRPEGWLPWKGEFALDTLYYGEFGSTGPAANATARVPWSRRIPAEHLAEYSVENFIQGHEWIPSNKRVAKMQK